MRNYKLTIAYDGSRYQGWQRQATTDNTIQYIMEWSLGRIVGYRVQVDGSGRTDGRGQYGRIPDDLFTDEFYDGIVGNTPVYRITESENRRI